jgi:hypothetical protein
MKRQGRFGLSIPLFPAQNADDILELFNTVARVRKINLTDPLKQYIQDQLGNRPLTGSDVEAILVRARERAVLSQRDNDVQLVDIEEAVGSFIDPLDPNLLALQELAAVLSCSDRRYMPPRYGEADRSALQEQYENLKTRLQRR